MIHILFLVLGLINPRAGARCSVKAEDCLFISSNYKSLPCSSSSCNNNKYTIDISLQAELIHLLFFCNSKACAPSPCQAETNNGETLCTGVSITTGRSSAAYVFQVAGDLVQSRARCIPAPSSLENADLFQRGKS